MEKRKIPIPAALPNCPNRHEMVRAAIHMERSGYTFDEWSTVDRLCDSCADVRSIILNYAKDILDMFDGLKPCNADYVSEMALIAAFRVYYKVRRENIFLDDKRVSYLLKDPAPWTEEQYKEAWEAYERRHPNHTRVTAALKASLERETCAVYGVPYEAKSGCVVIPFPAAKAESRAWES